MAHSSVDILVTDTGDLEVDSSGEISLATPAQTLSQLIKHRLLTDHRDYIPDPFLGADLGSELGQPNNERTGKVIAEKVQMALIRDGLVDPGSLTVDVFPIALEKVAIVVVVRDTIRGLEDPLALTFTWNYTTGTEEILTNISE